MMISKMIHYCWFGDNPPGEKEKQCFSSWNKYLKNYQIKKWGNDDIINLLSKNKYLSQAFNAKKWAFVSDYIRLYALYNYGGIYLDTDVEVKDNFDKFLEHDFFIGSEKNDFQYNVATAVIGANINNIIIDKLLHIYDEIAFIKPNGEYDQTANPIRFMECLKLQFNLQTEYNEKKAISFFKNSFLYPHTYFSTDAENSVAVHHFLASWIEGFSRKKIMQIKNIAIIRYKKRNNNKLDLPLYTNETMLKCFNFNRSRKYAIIRIDR